MKFMKDIVIRINMLKQVVIMFLLPRITNEEIKKLKF